MPKLTWNQKLLIFKEFNERIENVVYLVYKAHVAAGLAQPHQHTSTDYDSYDLNNNKVAVKAFSYDDSSECDLSFPVSFLLTDEVDPLIEEMVAAKVAERDKIEEEKRAHHIAHQRGQDMIMFKRLLERYPELAR